MIKIPKLYECPCCGRKTLKEKPPGTYLICSHCNWEDDLVQFMDPNYKNGANKLSLNEARAIANKKKDAAVDSA